MSENTDAPFTITLKGGKDFSDPWLVIRANTAQEAAGLLRQLGDLPQAVVEASNFFHATNNAAPLLPNAPQQQAPVPQQQTAPPGWAPAPQPQAQPAGHPEGKVCESCSSALQFKSGTSKAGKGYKLWACPNNRSRNDGHTVSFVD